MIFKEKLLVEITKDDIINLIKKYLFENGVEPVGDFKVNIESIDISDGDDRYPIYENSIGITTIECKRL